MQLIPYPLAFVLALGSSVSAQEDIITIGDVRMSVIITEETPTPKAIPTPKTKDRKAPKMYFTCTPQIAIAVGPFGSVVVSAKVRVMNPDESFWCPSVEWRVNNEFVSSHESDCLPYDQMVAEEGEPLVWSEPLKRFKLPSGNHTITVRLTKNDKRIDSGRCEVQIR